MKKNQKNTVETVKLRILIVIKGKLRYAGLRGFFRPFQFTKHSLIDTLIINITNIPDLFHRVKLNSLDPKLLKGLPSVLVQLLRSYPEPSSRVTQAQQPSTENSGNFARYLELFI